MQPSMAEHSDKRSSSFSRACCAATGSRSVSCDASQPVTCNATEPSERWSWAMARPSSCTVGTVGAARSEMAPTRPVGTKDGPAKRTGGGQDPAGRIWAVHIGKQYAGGGQAKDSKWTELGQIGRSPHVSTAGPVASERIRESGFSQDRAVPPHPSPNRNRRRASEQSCGGSARTTRDSSACGGRDTGIHPPAHAHRLASKQTEFLSCCCPGAERSRARGTRGVQMPTRHGRRSRR